MTVHRWKFTLRSPSARRTRVSAGSVRAAVAVLTAGRLVPGPVGAAFNGLVAALVVHTAAYYLLERTELLPGHDVHAGAERLP